MFHRQINREACFPENTVDVLITDSPVHLGFLYALELRENNRRDVGCLTDIFNEMSLINLKPRYDIIFYLSPLETVKSDGVRDVEHFDETWKQNADEMMQCIFRIFPPKHFVKIGPLDIDGRVAECMRLIKEFLKQPGEGTTTNG